MIRIPSEFKHWYGLEVMAARGLRGSIDLFSTAGFKDLQEKIDTYSLEKQEDPTFKEFLLAGFVACRIDGEGVLELPDYLIKYLRSSDAATVKEQDCALQIS